jgi:hypothetical protein
MYLKIHKPQNIRPVVALCDSELLGKKFDDGKRQLDIRENFYKGDKVNEEQAINIIKIQSVEDASFNIVGKKSIDVAIKAGIITKEGAAKIRNIPFALVLL